MTAVQKPPAKEDLVTVTIDGFEISVPKGTLLIRAAEQLGIQITPFVQQSPEALRAFQKAESERWWPIIKAANLKAE